MGRENVILCDRCGKQTSTHKMSKLNVDILCKDCLDKEESMWFYEDGAEIERKHAFSKLPELVNYRGIYNLTVEEWFFITSIRKRKEMLGYLLSKTDARDLFKLLSISQKNFIFNEIQHSNVCQDVESLNETLTKDQVIKVANLYVYEGDYDCNLSYWDNLEKLIYEVKKA